MADWLVPAKTWWKLERAVKASNDALEILKDEKHPFR
jgi:hypothetical protein